MVHLMAIILGKKISIFYRTKPWESKTLFRYEKSYHHLPMSLRTPQHCIIFNTDLTLVKKGITII